MFLEIMAPIYPIFFTVTVCTSNLAKVSTSGAPLYLPWWCCVWAYLGPTAETSLGPVFKALAEK